MPRSASKIFGETRQAVLSIVLLESTAQHPLYTTEIIQRVGKGSGAVQRQLAKLVEEEIIIRKRDGRRQCYLPNKRNQHLPQLRKMLRAMKVTCETGSSSNT